MVSYIEVTDASSPDIGIQRGVHIVDDGWTIPTRLEAWESYRFIDEAEARELAPAQFGIASTPTVLSIDEQIAALNELKAEIEPVAGIDPTPKPVTKQGK